jgi:hypothetical protein
MADDLLGPAIQVRGHKSLPERAGPCPACSSGYSPPKELSADVRTPELALVPNIYARPRTTCT